ncbi:MAG: c-type cytochrome [Acidobacteria bacterium]|nr:c-type cytochrome [Acidobacteriota bacterium]
MAVIHSEAPPVHRPSRRNFWFAVSSILMLVVTVWMFYADYNREWKSYQREFRALDLQRAAKKVAELDGQYKNSKDLVKLESALDAARKDVASKAGDIDRAKAAVAEADHKHFLAESEWKVSKSYFDAFKFEVEEARETGRGVAKAEKEYTESKERYEKSVVVLGDVDKEKDAADRNLRALTATFDDVQRKITTLTETRTRLQKKLQNFGPNAANEFRDRPVVDFMNPSIRVQQVQLPTLQNDVNFMKIPKVDRCTTCHLAATEKGYDDLKQPFRSHSHLELIANTASKHPYERFGCTTCHYGLDRATYFESAVHTPGSDKQREEWRKTHHWEQPEFSDIPMLPTAHTEGACLKCHRQEVRIAGAPRLNKSLDMLDRAGCFGCHKIAGTEGLRKPGPDLRRIASKVTPEWAAQWVSNPRAYRPTTWMPKFFNLSNTSAPDDQVRNRVEIDAIVTYLFKHSSAYTLDPIPAKGDASRGRETMSERGCLGCHRVGENPTARGAYGRDFGPALDRVGDKMSEVWVYNWVKNPTRYFPESYMPDLRLTDQEAADVASYLMTLKGPAGAPLPAVDPGVLDSVTVEYLKARMTEADAQSKLKSMSTEDKKLYLGDKLINRYGCFGCHRIEGYDKALPIGTELTQEGSKLVSRLDFGFAKIERTRQDWFFQKLKEPRIFDKGKVKTPQEKLKMPDFGFTDEEGEQMVTLLLGLVKDEPILEARKILSEREAAIEDGRRIAQHRNCRGCHILEGTGGAIRETIKDAGFYPPNLIGEGGKVQSDWLFSFLKGPQPIRPWLKVHMPTFSFDDREAASVARYFASLDDAIYPFETAAGARPTAAHLADGKALFTQFKCLQCHVVGAPGASVSAAELAPNLLMARSRLRRDWIPKWLTDPQKQYPGTKMPSFFYSDGDPLMEDPDTKIIAIRDYLFTLGEEGSGRSGPTAKSASSSSPTAAASGR